MSIQRILLLVWFITLWLLFTIDLVPKSIKMCKENNPLGILILFLLLNIIGLILGIYIFIKNKN